MIPKLPFKSETSRVLLLCLFFAIGTSVTAQHHSSEQLRENFLTILKGEIMEMIDHAAAHDPVITQRVSREIGPMMKEVESNYGQLLTLPEDEANRLLTSGPNDSANRGAMARNLELWNEVQRPMPVLLKRMQDEVATGKIHGGLELELTKRISEFHLRQLGML